MAAVHVDDLLAGDVSQPEEKRQRLIREIIGQSLGGLKKGFLEDIGVVDAALKQPVEAKSDHLLEPLAIAGEELVNGRIVTAGCAFEQIGQLIGI